MRASQLLHNPISYAGVVIATLAAIVFFFLLVLSAFANTATPYASLIIFVLVPAFLLFGLFLIVLGMVRERRHVRRTGTQSIPRFPVLNFNDPDSRRAAAVIGVGALLLLFFSVFGSYQAIEATESVAFCGATCHTPMRPEYVTYQNSPHARVRCVDCHVGPGAQSYVKAKLNGVPQVYGVVFNNYPRPIPAPIDTLRPARETCEHCHWPEVFVDGQQKRLAYFLPDEQNTRWEIDLLVKVGGGRRGTALATGGHWHVNRNNRVEYIAVDDARQQIAWVRMTDRSTGAVTEYMSTANPLSPTDRAKATVRTMDCIDCHNRPTHIFLSPQESVNHALEAGRLDRTLPFLRKTAVELLSAEYESTEVALRAIADGLTAFYRKDYPQIADSRSDAIAGAAGELQAIFGRTIFPYMKARWDKYPNNIGHLMFPGCFRCHDGQHASADGKVIDHDCNTCHSIASQGKAGAVAYAAGSEGLGFQHPEEIGDLWQQSPCNGCHTGANP